MSALKVHKAGRATWAMMKLIQPDAKVTESDYEFAFCSGYEFAKREASEVGPHDWTHHADECDVPGCDHITRRTCEGSEKVIRFLLETLRKRTDLLCKADPEWERRAFQNVLRAAFEKAPVATCPGRDCPKHGSLHADEMCPAEIGESV